VWLFQLRAHDFIPMRPAQVSSRCLLYAVVCFMRVFPCFGSGALAAAGVLSAPEQHPAIIKSTGEAGGRFLNGVN
jgi:hypothetical protein